MRRDQVTAKFLIFLCWLFNLGIERGDDCVVSHEYIDLACSLQETYEAKRNEFMGELQKKEEEMRQMFVQRVKEKEAELKEAEKEVCLLLTTKYM